MNDLRKSDIVELKSLKKPPEPVKMCVQAAYILVEQPSASSKDVWKECQRLLGNPELLKNMAKFDPKNCYLDSALAAKACLEPLSIEIVRKTSKAAASLYSWADWRSCQKLMGRADLLTEMDKFDPKNCYLNSALSAKAFLEPYSENKIRNTSWTAQSLYSWVPFEFDVRCLVQNEQSRFNRTKDPQNACRRSKKCFEALYILLEQPHSGKADWKSCEKLMVRADLLKVMENFDPKYCCLDSALSAKACLEPFSLEKIKNTSMAAVSLYSWCIARIGEVESCGGIQREG